MRGDVMLGAITLLGKALTADLALEFFDLQVNDAVMLACRARVSEGATTFLAFDVLTLPSLGLERLGNSAGCESFVVAAVACGLGGGGRRLGTLAE